jgi:hypothetical protein
MCSSFQRHSGRLDQVFKALGQRPQAVRCPAIDGLIGEAEEVASEVDDKSQNCGQSLDEPMLKKLKPGLDTRRVSNQQTQSRTCWRIGRGVSAVGLPSVAFNAPAG